jgi:hypothetical protein
MISSQLSIWEKIRRRYLRAAPKYQTNFHRTKQGNGLYFGEKLSIRIKDAEVVTGRIYDHITNKTYQINQSHDNDTDKDAETISFTLKTKLHPQSVKPEHYLPVGEYVLFTWWWDNDTMRGGTYRDKFIIS